MRLLGLSLAFGRMEMAEEDMERKIRESLERESKKDCVPPDGGRSFHWLLDKIFVSFRDRIL